MTDREFYVEVRKGMLIIMAAMVRRFGASYTDFLPKTATPAPVYSASVITPPPEYTR